MATPWDSDSGDSVYRTIEAAITRKDKNGNIIRDNWGNPIKEKIEIEIKQETPWWSDW